MLHGSGSVNRRGEEPCPERFELRLKRREALCVRKFYDYSRIQHKGEPINENVLTKARVVLSSAITAVTMAGGEVGWMDTVRSMRETITRDVVIHGTDDAPFGRDGRALAPH